LLKSLRALCLVVTMQYFHAPSDVALIGAVQRAEIDTVKTLLRDCSASITSRDDKGYTALHWAAYIDNVQILDALIEAENDLLWTAMTHNGQTVLHIACSNASLRCIARILELLRESTQQQGYIDIANKYKETALHVAASTNRVDIVQQLLEVGQANPYLLDQWQRTPRKVI
jgi:ankyrin repeat protein